MSHYRRNQESNRDALFGNAPSASSSSSSAPRPTPPTAAARARPKPTPVLPNNTNNEYQPNIPSNARRNTSRTNTTKLGTLSGDAKDLKMKEAEKYREKAKRALQRTMFSKPDPIGAAMYYHKAAEAYKVCNENRLERLHRIASGDCQKGHGAYATAASEYIRAAELSLESDETPERKKAECLKLYADAAEAWREAGDNGRAGECLFKSAFSALITDNTNNTNDNNHNHEDDNNEDVIDGIHVKGMDKKILTEVEKAIEAFVPDPLNRYSQFRVTGTSEYTTPEAADGTIQDNKNAEQQQQTKTQKEQQQDLQNLCQDNMITTSFAHETLFDVIYKLTSYAEYSSALYAAGAASTILESDTASTISTSRSYCIETILALAVGDVILADHMFCNVHLQKNFYLTSRECKLAEDLIRAIKMRDLDDLEEVRSSNGSNRAAMSNLHSSLRNVVVKGLRITGAAKKKSNTAAVASATTSTSSSNKTTEQDRLRSSQMTNSVLQKDLNDNFAEMDDLLDDMGIGSDMDDDDDDELDLR